MSDIRDDLVTVALFLFLLLKPPWPPLNHQIFADAKEFCHNDQFLAECPEGHVILMTSALYGRMRKGSCVKTDFGFVGCYTDVLDHVHGRCSGRPSCSIRVPDATLDRTRPCNEDLKSYLDANFTCIQGDSSSCVVDAPLVTGFLSNRVQPHSGTSNTAALDCGTDGSPWTVTVRTGQRINVTLLDFTTIVNNRSPTALTASSSQGGCDTYASFEESGATERSTLCGGTRLGGGGFGGTRGGGVKAAAHVITTDGNRLLVVVDKQRDERYNFLLKLDAIGCPDVGAPSYGWMRRDGGELTIGCDAEKDVWKFDCVGTNWELEKEAESEEGWVGEFDREPARNCTPVSSKNARREDTLSALSVGASILIILGVSLSIGLVVLLFGLYYMRRKRIGNVIGQESLAMRDVKPLRCAAVESPYDTNTMYARNRAFEPIRVKKKNKAATLSTGPGAAGAVLPSAAGGGDTSGKVLTTDDGSEYEYVWDAPFNLTSSRTLPEVAGLQDVPVTRVVLKPIRTKTTSPPDIIHQVADNDRTPSTSSNTPSSSPRRQPPVGGSAPPSAGVQQCSCRPGGIQSLQTLPHTQTSPSRTFSGGVRPVDGSRTIAGGGTCGNVESRSPPDARLVQFKRAATLDNRGPICRHCAAVACASANGPSCPSATTPLLGRRNKDVGAVGVSCSSGGGGTDRGSSSSGTAGTHGGCSAGQPQTGRRHKTGIQTLVGSLRGRK